MGAQVRVDGARKLRRELKRMGEDLDDLKAVNAAVAAFVATAAAGAAPRRTGALAGTVRGNRAVSRATVSAGRAAVPYAGPVHWGWPARNIAPQPFISEVAQGTEAQWVDMYRRGVEEAIGKVRGDA